MPSVARSHEPTTRPARRAVHTSAWTQTHCPASKSETVSATPSKHLTSYPAGLSRRSHRGANRWLPMTRAHSSGTRRGVVPAAPHPPARVRMALSRRAVCAPGTICCRTTRTPPRPSAPRWVSQSASQHSKATLLNQRRLRSGLVAATQPKRKRARLPAEAAPEAGGVQPQRQPRHRTPPSTQACYPTVHR